MLDENNDQGDNSMDFPITELIQCIVLSLQKQEDRQSKGQFAMVIGWLRIPMQGLD